MANPDLPFSMDEYADRLARTRASMAEAGLDALIITNPANMNWLTGYDGWSFYVHQAVLVTMDGEPRWWGRPMDGVGAQKTSYLSDDSIFSYPDDFVQNVDKHAYSHFCGVLAELGLSKARIGVEMDNYYFTAACYVTLVIGLPDAKILDATSLVTWQRSIKSDQEITYLRRAARIVEKMHERIRQRTEVGMRKCDLVAEIYEASVRGTPEFGGDYSAIVPLTPSGKDAAAAHLTWDDRPMKSEEGTFFEISGSYKHYHCPMSRTLYLGTPPDSMLRAQEAVMEGLMAGIDKARPGVTCEEVAEELFRSMRKHGVHKEGRCGYSVGVSYPPDWGEHTMSLRPGDTTEIKAGMVFHFMPAIWTEDWGFETTETMLIRPEGPAECLANVSRELFVKA